MSELEQTREIRRPLWTKRIVTALGSLAAVAALTAVVYRTGIAWTGERTMAKFWAGLVLVPTALMGAMAYGLYHRFTAARAERVAQDAADNVEACDLETTVDIEEFEQRAA